MAARSPLFDLASAPKPLVAASVLTPDPTGIVADQTTEVATHWLHVDAQSESPRPEPDESCAATGAAGAPEMAALEEMGFADGATNRAALYWAEGDVSGAIELLLANSA